MNVKKIIGKANHFLKKSTRDNISAISAQSAFFLLLSIVPFLMFTFAILSYFNIPTGFYDSYLGGLFTEDVGAFIRNSFDTAYKNSVGIAFTTIIAALWSAGKGLYSVTEGINRIYKIRSKRMWLIKRIFAMVYTLIMFIVVVVTMIVLVGFEFFDDLLTPLIKNLPYAIELLYTLRYVVVFVLLVILMSLAMKMYLRNKVRDKRWAKFRLQLPGVTVTALSWVLLSFGLKIYVKYFNGFSIYGSIAAFAVVMIWVYFSMYIMLYCIQFNYVFRYGIYNFSFKSLFKRFLRKKDIDKNS